MKYTEEELKILQQLMPGKFQQEAQATQQQQPQLPEIKLPEPELKSSGLDAFTTGLKQGLFADAPGSAWSVLKDLTPTGLGLDPYYNQKIQENIEQGQAYQEQLTPEAQQSMAYTAGSSIGGIAPVAAGAVLTAPFSGGASAAALFGGMTGLNVGGNTYEFEQRRRAELLQSNPNLTEEQIQAEVDLGRKQVALESLPLAAGEAAATMLTGGLGRGAKTVLGGAAKSALADAPINIASAGLQESIVGGALEGGVDEELRKEKMIMGGITGGIVSGVMGGIEAAKKKSIPLPNDIAQKRAEALNQIAPAGINYETRPATDKDGNVIQGRSEVWEVNNRKPEVAVEQPIETPITQKPVEEVQPTDANAIPKVEEEEVKPADVAPKVEETQIDAEKTQEIQTVEQPQQDNQTVSKTDAKSIEIPVQNLTKDNFVSNGVDLPETTTFEQRTIKTRELDPITNKAKNIEKTINVASDRDNLGFGLTLNQTLADKQNLETKGKADVITPIKTSKLNLDTLSDNFVYKKYLKEGETALNSGANLLVARNKNIKERVIGSYDFYDRSVVKDNQGNKALEFVASINPSKFEPYLTNVRNIKDTDEVFLVREKTEQFPENTAVYVNTVNEKTKQVETVKVAKLERNVAREVAKFLDANGIDNIEVKLGAVEMPYSKKAEQDFSRQSYTRMNEKGEKETIMARTIIAGRINLNKNADNVLNQISKEKPIKQIDNVVEKQQSQVPVDEKAVEIENNLKKLNASNQKIKVYFDYNGSEGKYTGKDLEELNQFRKQQKELKANGIFSPEDNVVYLSYEQIAKNAKKNGIPVEEMVEFVYTHEVLGHGSMKVFFKSDEELNKFLDAEILKAEKEDGIIKYLMDNKAKTYKNADKRELIEEVFADLANGKVKVKEGEEYVIKDITQLSKEFAVLKKLTREQEAGIVRGLINAIKDLFDKLTGNDNFQVRQEKKSENQLLNAYNELKQMQKALEGSSVKDNADNVAISDKLKFEKEDKFNDKNYALSQLKNRGQDLDLYSEKIRDDEDVVLIAVQDLPSSFRYASDRLKDNKEFALKILNFNGGLYFNLSRKLQNDKEIILKSLKNYKFIFEDIPVLLKNKYGNDIDDFIVNIEKDIKAEKFAENLDQTLAKKPEETAVAKKKPVKLDKEIDWDNKEEVLAQVKNAGYTLMYASDKLRDNKEVVKNAVKSSGASLEYSSDRLKDDKYIVSQAIKENGLALGFASNRLKDDKELVLEAMKENIGAIQYASNRLKDDKELVLTAVKEAGEYLTIASNRLKDDDEVVKTAFDTWNYSLRKASDRLKVKYVKENPENIKYVGYKEEGEQERIQKLIDAEKFAENLDKTLAKKPEETAVAKKKPMKLDTEEKYVPIKDIVSKNISDEEKNKIIKNAKQNIEKQLKELNENYAHSDIGLVITYKNKRGLTPLEKEIVAKHNKDNFGGPGLFLEHEGKNYISINIDNVINSPLAKELSFEDYAKFVYGHEMIGHGAIGNKFKTNEEKLKFLMKIYRNSSPIFKNLVTKKEDLYPENLGTRIEEVLADLSVGKVSYYNDKNEIVVKSIEQYAYDFSYELAKSQNIGRPEALKQIMVDLMNAIKTAINEFTGTPIFKVYSTIKDELSTIKQELKDIQQELGISSKELFEANEIKYKLDKEEAILVGKISENPDYLKSQEYQSVNNSKISLFINNFIPSSASIPWIGDMFNKAMSNEAFKGGFDIMTRIGDTDKTIDYHFQKMMKNIYNEKFGWKTGLKKKEKEVLNKALFETMMSNGKFSEKDLIQKFGMNDKTVIAYNDLIDVLKRASEVKAMSKILKKAYTSGFSNEFIYNKYKDIQDFNFIKFVKEIQKDAQDLDIEGLESLTNFIDEQSIKVSSILEFDIVPTQEFYGYVTDKDNNVVDMKQFKSKFHANMWKKQTEIENKANGYTVKTDKTPTKIEEVEDKTSNFNRIANEYKQYAAKSYKEGKTAEVPFDFFVNSFAVIDNVSKTSSLNIHLRMVNNYIEKLRANKDAKTADELEKLRDYELQADSVIATKIRHFNSIYNLGGSVASAISNFTSIPMVVEPYLGRYGNDKSLTKLFAQLSTDRKVLFGNLNSDQLAEHIATKYIKNGDKAQAIKDIKRLIEAGLLYDVSDYDLAKVKEGIDLTGKFTNIKSVAVNAYMAPFAKSEAINKLVTGIAALDVAYKNSKDGFDFTKETIYATQGYYGKLGRPVWARSGIGQLLYQFKTYPLNYASLLIRLAGGDKKDKIAAGKMLGMLILLGGVKSIPFASDSGDLIDTFGRLFGFETTDSGKEVEDIMKSMLGDEAGLLLTYGIASEFGLPFNLQQRIAFNDIIPGTKLFDPAVKDKTQELKQIGGPTVSNTGNIMEGIKQFAKGNYYQSMYNVAPSAGKALLQGVTALTDDKFVDKNGKTITTATADEALIRILGFQPKNLAEVYRGIERIEVQKQNIEYFKSLVYDLLASSQIEKDMSKKILANRMIKEFNSQNPTTKIEINQSVLTRRINDRKTTLEERYKKQLPKELREEYEQITK